LTAILVVLAGVAAVGATFARAAATTPSPGVVAGGFCTYRTGYFKTSTEAAQRINQYFAAGAVGSEIFHVGPVETPVDDPATYAYTWRKTGTPVSVGQGKNTVQVDSGVAALLRAMASAGRPGAFTENAINPTTMGSGGVLAAQALAEKINQGFSEVFVTPATGFSGLSFVNMEDVQLDGVQLTPAEASALKGQATLQVREAADAALGGGPLPYGLTFSQATDLIDLVNGSFAFCAPSAFAQTHLYQPYVTSPSGAFAGARPSTVSTFASKPTYNSFSREVVYEGRGCPANSFVVPGSPPGSPPNNLEDAYPADPSGKIALIERGACTFYAKIQRAQDAGASAVIIFNSKPAAADCPTVPTPGANNCEALVGMGAASGVAPLTIPAAFVQRSTGLLLKNGTGVTAFVQQ
jgi:PA domain